MSYLVRLAFVTLHRRVRCWGGISVVLVLFWGTDAAGNMLALTDMAHRKVTVPMAPQRLICLGPGTLGLVTYLGAVDRVVAVEDVEKQASNPAAYHFAYPELAQLPRCSSGGPASINHLPDLEMLLQMAPQVIFVAHMQVALADEIERRVGIPVVVLGHGVAAEFNPIHYYNALRMAATILDKTERAEALIRFIEAEKTALQTYCNQIPQTQRVSSYVGGIDAQGLLGSDPDYLPFRWVNVDNLAKMISSEFGFNHPLSHESLLTMNPETIFIDGGNLNRIYADYRAHPNFYQALQAVSNRKVFFLLPIHRYDSGIATVLCNAYAVGKILYPRQFEMIDLAAKADEIYGFMLGRPIYAKMTANACFLGQVVQLLQ